MAMEEYPLSTGIQRAIHGCPRREGHSSLLIPDAYFAAQRAKYLVANTLLNQKTIRNMGLFDFFKSSKGIESKKFNSEQYQLEILAFAHMTYFENNQKYPIVLEKLQEKGLSKVQAEHIVGKLKAKNAKMVSNFQEELDSGKITGIKVIPNEEHTKENTNKDQVDKYIGFGAYQLERGDLENALELFDKAIELDENAVLAYANKGNLYAKRGDFERAIHFYDKALSIDTTQKQIFSAKASTLDEMGRFEEAVEVYEKVLSMDDKDIQTLNNLGIAYARKGLFEKALSCFERLLNIDANDSDALLNKFNALVHVDLDGAIAFYKKLRGLLPNVPEINYIIPNHLYAQGDIGAIDQYFEHLKREAQDTIFIKYQGHFYYAKDQAKALGYYNEYLEFSPKDPEVLAYRMHLLGNMGNLQTKENFIHAIDEVLAVDKTNLHALANKTQYYNQLNDLESSLIAVKELFKHHFSDQTAIHLLQHIFSRLEDKGEILAMYDAFSSELTGDAAYQLGYCRALYLKGIRDFEESITAFHNLNKQFEFAWNYYQIAIMKNVQNKREEALTFLAKTFALDPSLKEDAKQYIELENLWADPMFIALVNS